jgi:hypothetical protein
MISFVVLVSLSLIGVIAWSAGFVAGRGSRKH